MGDKSWVSRVALLASLLALGVSGYGIYVSHADRTRDTRYSIRAQIRNLSGREAVYGLSSDVRPKQLVEFRGRLHNWGNFPARDVTIDVDSPSVSSGTVVRGSCTVRRPGKAPSRCDGAMDERHLTLRSLPPNGTMEVTFKLRTRLPPCDGYRADATFTARSADRQAISDTATAYVARSSDGLVCGSDDATLMGLIPLGYRGRCGLSHYTRVVGDSAAHIRCERPTAGVPVVEYWLYANEARAKRVYRRRVRAISSAVRTKCSTDEDGEGWISYRGRSRQELRYVCWKDPGAGAWIEILNRRHKLFVSAYRSDGDAAALFTWANKSTP